MAKYISFGKISSLHGVKGELSLECFFGNYAYFIENNLCFFKRNEEIIPLKISVNGHKKESIVIIVIEGYGDIESARKLLKQEVFIEREAMSALEDGEGGHFVSDLLNLTVLDAEDGKLYGLVVDVVDFGSGPLLEIAINHQNIKNEKKKEKLEYYEKDERIVKEVNLLKGYILLNVSEGCVI